MTLVLALGTLWLLYSIGGVAFKYPPFASRRTALLSSLVTFILQLAVASIGSGHPQSAVGGTTAARPGSSAQGAKQLEAEMSAGLAGIGDLVRANKFDEAVSKAARLPLPPTADQAKAVLDSIHSKIAAMKPSELKARSEAYSLLSYLNPSDAENAKKAAELKARVSEQEAQARAAERRKLLSGYRKDVDKFNNTTFYTHRNSPIFVDDRPVVYAYIGESDANYHWLRMKVVYTGDSWLFVEQVLVNYDGNTEVLYDGSFNRDNSTDIWEWADVSPSETQIELLRKIARAKDVTFRYDGQQYRRDVKMRASDKKALADVLAAYDKLRSGELK